MNKRRHALANKNGINKPAQIYKKTFLSFAGIMGIPGSLQNHVRLFFEGASIVKHSRKIAFIFILNLLITNKILADYTINSGSVTDPASTPALLNATGTISIYGTMAINSDVTFTSTSPLKIIIYGASGQIYWNSNKTLALPEGSSVTFVNNPTAPPGFQPSSGSASKILQIGSVKYAAANDNSNNIAFSFAQLNTLGGTARVSPSTSTPTICSNSSGTLSANKTLPTGTDYYVSWSSSETSASFSDNNTSTASTCSVSGLPAGTDKIICRLYANSGGGSYFLVGTDSFNITVNSAPSISGSLAVCIASSTQLTGSGTPSTSSPWKSSSAGIATVSNTGLVTSVAPGSTVITYKSSNGCSTDSTVTVNPPASATIGYDGNVFCDNNGVANVIITGTTGGTFSMAPDGASINAGNGRINLSSSTPGRYTVTYAVASNGCSATEVTTDVQINPNTWKGNSSSNWHTAGNWAGTYTIGCPTVTIPGNVTYQPIITSETISLQNLNIESGGNLTLSGGTLQVSGTISNSGILDASNGTIEMNGAGAQDIAANTFLNNNVKNLVISNSSAGGVTLDGPLDIYGSLTYTGTGKKLFTNDNLTLKSNAAATAYVGNMTGNTISGKVTVERYISAQRGWKFLSVPTNTSQTIQQTWQEGATSAASNPVAGFGTQITGAAGTAAGFDAYSPSPAMKTYNAATGTWVGVPSTNTTYIKATDGYMVFIRGDRSVSSPFLPPTTTVLRTKGDLYVGDLPAINVAAGKFAAIGNPYASAIDMRNISKTGIKDFFYVWDPQLAGTYGYGGYQTFSDNGAGDYVVTPGGGSYGSAGSISNYIQSGQAFFVQGTSSGGSLTFQEADKATGSSLVFTPATVPLPQLRVTLYTVKADNSTELADGFLVNFGDNYSAAIDDMDAIKSSNSSENLSVKRGNSLLVIERRPTITSKDTVVFNLANVGVKKYRFEIDGQQLYQPGLTAYLIDNYLHTSTPLTIEGTTTVDFNIVNIAGSYAANRFQIVFSQPLAVLPVTFTSVKAYNQDSNILVKWQVENESNLKQYEVQKSADGSTFNSLHITQPANSSAATTYNFTDEHPLKGYNYYRIKSTDFNGKIAYSEVVTVAVTSPATPHISIFPNPIVSNIIHLRMNNELQGRYQITIIDQVGQKVLQETIDHREGANVENITLGGNISHGPYNLKVTSPSGKVTTLTLLY